MKVIKGKWLVIVVSLLLVAIVLSVFLFKTKAVVPIKRMISPPVVLQHIPPATNLSPERKIIRTFLTSQLNQFRQHGVTQEQLNAVTNAPESIKKQLALIRVQIIDQKIYFQNWGQPGYAENFLAGIHKVVSKYKIKNIDFISYMSDNMNCAADKKLSNLFHSMPAFHSNKNPNKASERNFILIPDPHMLHPSHWANLHSQIKSKSSSTPWSSKIDKIFWRGATTGLVTDDNSLSYNLDNYSKLPRLTLVMMSLSFPEKIDARFTKFCQLSSDKSGKDLFKVFELLFEDVPILSEIEHLPYKYLISIDGNAAAWVRPEWIMASNSVLLFQHTYVQWFYCAMRPWVHYVPIKDDISDIFEKFEWLKTHDAQAQQISQNATKFIENALLPEHITQDLAFMLNEYASIQKFNLQHPTLPAY